MNDYICSNCGSKRLFHVRIDSDWGDGGDFTRVNSDKFYKECDPQNYEHIDIEFTVCFECNTQDRMEREKVNGNLV